MALISLTSGGPATVVRFDAVQVVEHGLTATVTEHSVERGANISDNVRPERPTLTVTGIVSNTPLFTDAVVVAQGGVALPAGVYRPVQLAQPPVVPRVPVFLGIGDAIGNAVSKVTAPKTVDALVFDGLQSRVRQITEALTEALEGKFLVSVTDEAADYDDLIIEGRVITRTVEGGKAAKIVLNMRQMRFVSSQLVDVPIEAALRAQALATAGSAAAQGSPVEEAKKVQAKSLAATLFDGARAGL